MLVFSNCSQIILKVLGRAVRTHFATAEIDLIMFLDCVLSTLKFLILLSSILYSFSMSDLAVSTEARRDRGRICDPPGGWNRINFFGGIIGRC